MENIKDKIVVDEEVFYLQLITKKIYLLYQY